jgi:hypothetical protein
MAAGQANLSVSNLQERLRRQTRELEGARDERVALAEVLRIVASSPNDAQPVFESIVKSVPRLCQAKYCWVFRFDGKLIHFAAEHGLSDETVEAIRKNYPIPPGRASAAARAILTCATAEIPDVHADPDYQHAAASKAMNFLSVAAVPMLKDGRPLGAIVMARTQPGRFPKPQLELLRTFADQAVIAIENTRLLNELRESLQQQTATSEVLRVISLSPGALEPVFKAMLDSAVRICEARFGGLWLRTEDGFRTEALYNAPPAFAEVRPLGAIFHVSPGNPMSQALITGQPVQIADVLQESRDDVQFGNEPACGAAIYR